MNAQIPTNIAEIIENTREELQLQGQIKYNEHLQKAILQVPEWIRPYLDQPLVNYERIAQEWDRVEGMRLHFSISGLAPIQFDSKDERWRSAVAHMGDAYDQSPPSIAFGNDSYWKATLESTLIAAENEMTKYAAFDKEWKALLERNQKEQEERAQRDNEREAQEVDFDHQRYLKEMQEQAEEQAIFDAIKNDPIAIHMLKAFVLLSYERSTFEQRLSEADEAMYSIDNHWSRKAEELRRQADDAQRRADNEKYRLQSDLDDAEAKLKKEQRGW